MNISYSAVDKYNTCPRMYKHHYIDRIRPKNTTSALLFGSAVDDALNELLLNFKDNESRLKKCITVYNQEMSKWLNSNNVDFFNKDFDRDILQDSDISSIEQARDDRKDHYYGWYCLYRKGLELLKKYELEVIPKIKEVVSVQQSIKKSNQSGDNIVMYLDAVLIWHDDDNPNNDLPSVSDHKTSSSSYSKKKIDTSRQLALYSFFTNLEDISYVVMRKDLNSKGQLRPIQILHSKATDELKTDTLDEIDQVLNHVKNKRFPKTDKKWQCKKMFGKLCPYYDICHNNKKVEDCSNLIQK